MLIFLFNLEFIWFYIEAKTKGIIFSVVIMQVGTLIFEFLNNRKQNIFFQYSFRLSVLALYPFIQLRIDVVYIEVKTKGMIFSVVIIHAGTYLTFQKGNVFVEVTKLFKFSSVRMILHNCAIEQAKPSWQLGTFPVQASYFGCWTQ